LVTSFLLLSPSPVERAGERLCVDTFFTSLIFQTNC
jgi:hypothetical protein